MEYHCPMAAHIVTHWGEVVGKTRKAYGLEASGQPQDRLLPLGLEGVPVDIHRAGRAGTIKVELGIPDSDAFAVELALGSTDTILITADFDFKPAEQLIQIEFLPTKPASHAAS
jgi:hypothetical protein